MSTFRNRSELYPKGAPVTVFLRLSPRQANGLLLMSRQRGCTVAQMARDAIDFIIESAQELGRLPDPIPEPDPEPMESWTPPEPEPPAPDRSLLTALDPATVIIAPPVETLPGDCVVSALRRQERAG